MAEETFLAIQSFKHFNPEWEIRLLDLGLEPDHKHAVWSMVDRVFEKPRWTGGACRGRYPAGLARAEALAHWVDSTSVMLMVDSDTITFGAVTSDVSSFLQTGLSIAFEPEDDPRFPWSQVGFGWNRPPSLLPHFREWQTRCHLSTGVMLATGDLAANIGSTAVSLLQGFGNTIRFAEQTAINGVVYEQRIPWYRLGNHFHCFYEEKYLARDGIGYLVDGRRVLIRHYQGIRHKHALRTRLRELKTFFSFRTCNQK